MIIKTPFILFESLSFEDIELLREIRNEHSKRLLNPSYISPESQIKWFQSLDHSKNIYLKFKDNNYVAGFIFAKEINTLAKSIHTGIFTSNSYHHTSLPALAAITLGYYFLEKLNFKQMYSTVHSDNYEALSFNKKIGFKLYDDQNQFLYLECSKNDFLNKNLVLIKKLKLDKNLEIQYFKTDKKYTFINYDSI